MDKTIRFSKITKLFSVFLIGLGLGISQSFLSLSIISILVGIYAFIMIQFFIEKIREEDDAED